MKIVTIGLNYKTAPVEIRETLAFAHDTLEQAFTELYQQQGISESIILSTCNRTEFYLVTSEPHLALSCVEHFLEEWFQVDKQSFQRYLQYIEGEQAVEHLFRVITGIDSMVLGETQILGQIKQAFALAQQLGTTGIIFNQLFKQAITFSKQIHYETEINGQSVSISYIAIELVKQLSHQLEDKHVVIVGTGKVGRLAIEHLCSAGAVNITIVNRTMVKAKQLAEQFHVKYAPFKQLKQCMATADIVICSSSAKTAILSKHDIWTARYNQNDQPLLLIDLAVPRDINPQVRNLDYVTLYDIDDFQHIADEHIVTRRQIAEKIAALIPNEIQTFYKWIELQKVVPAITALRKKAAFIQQETMASIERKMPSLTKREQQLLNKHTKSIVNQLLKDPINYLKDLSIHQSSKDQLTVFSNIFGIHLTSNETKERQKCEEIHNK